VPVSPRPELGPVLGVESQPVDVVGRGPARDPDDVVTRQVDGLPLDLVLQDSVDTAVQHRVLIRIEHFHGPDKSLIYHLYPLRKSIKMTVFKVRPLVGVTKRASVITADLPSHGSDAVGFAAPRVGQGFWFIVASIVLLMWLLLRSRRRRWWFGFNITATIVFTVEMSEHLEASRVLLYGCRGGGLSLGKLEEPLVLRDQLVVVVVVVQVLHTVVRVVRQAAGDFLFLLFGSTMSVVVVCGVFVLPRSLCGQDDLHWWLSRSLSGSDTRSWSARWGRRHKAGCGRLVVSLLLLLLLLLLL